MKWGWSRARPWPARASVERKGERHPAVPASSCKKSGPGRQKKLEARGTIRIWGSPNSHVPVAACWSVGIRTRGRTAARGWRTDGGDGHPSNHASRFPQGRRSPTQTGSRRQNRRTPNLHGGRSLKQRRSGLFWSRWLSTGQHRRGLSFIAGRAGSSPIERCFGSGRLVRCSRRLHSASRTRRIVRRYIAPTPLAS